MPVRAVCPECEAEYTLPNEQRGKNVRCKECKCVFTVGGAGPKPEQPSRSSISEKPGRPAASKVAASRRAQEEPDDDEIEDEEEEEGGFQPKRGRVTKKRSQSKTPLIIAASV